MAKGYSADLRVRIHGAIKGGVSCRAAARHYGVSASTSVRLAQRVAATGSVEPGRQGRPPGGGKLAPYAELLIGWVETHKDITMPELAARLKAEKDVVAHPASLSRFLIARGFSFKKTLQATEAGRADVAEERRTWVTKRQPYMRRDPNRLRWTLIFIGVTMNGN